MSLLRRVDPPTGGGWRRPTRPLALIYPIKKAKFPLLAPGGLVGEGVCERI